MDFASHPFIKTCQGPGTKDSFIVNFSFLVGIGANHGDLVLNTGGEQGFIAFWVHAPVFKKTRTQDVIRPPEVISFGIGKALDGWLVTLRPKMKEGFVSSLPDQEFP